MTQVALNVAGMSCTGCEQRISAVLRRLDGVGRVNADHRGATVVVDFDPMAVEEATIVRRLEAAGYEVFEDSEAKTVAGRSSDEDVSR